MYPRPIESTLSDDEDEDEEEEEEERRKFTFPELDAKIREAVKQHGAVFPKLNFSSPRVSLCLLCLSDTYPNTRSGRRLDASCLLSSEMCLPGGRLSPPQIIRLHSP